MSQHSDTPGSHYFVPEPSPWPFIAMFAVFALLFGATLMINDVAFGGASVLLGALLLAFIFYAWFRDVIAENLSGAYNAQVDRSFRQGMYWFIASEVFFFASFFGALYYIRVIAVPWLGGAGYLGTSEILYNQFEAAWPTAGVSSAVASRRWVHGVCRPSTP